MTGLADTKRQVYLDYAATTPTDPRVLEAMLDFYATTYGNPSSLHFAGRQARQAVDEARLAFAAGLQAAPHEIIFTGGGSEADNLALKGVAQAKKVVGRHIITSASKLGHKSDLNFITLPLGTLSGGSFVLCCQRPFDFSPESLVFARVQNLTQRVYYSSFVARRMPSPVGYPGLLTRASPKEPDFAAVIGGPARSVPTTG